MMTEAAGRVRLAKLACLGFSLWAPEERDGTYMRGSHGSEMSCGTRLSERGKKSKLGAERTFHVSLLTGRHRVELAWRAT